MIVGQASPTLTTALNPSSIAAGGTDFDTAALSGFARWHRVDVTFTLYSDNACSRTPGRRGTVSVNESTGTVPNSNPRSSRRPGPSTGRRRSRATPTTAATASSCSSEPLISGQGIADADHGAHAGSIVAGGTDFDTAALSGFAPGGTASTVTYTVYSDNACSPNARAAGTSR